jgi:D-alanine-D-alanine ligase
MWRLAAGACPVADFRSFDRIEGTGGIFCLEVGSQPGGSETSFVPELAVFCGHNFDELVQWMVQDASLGRQDRGGPRLT